MAMTAVPGSGRSPLEGAAPVGRVAPAERLEVTVLVRRRDAAGFRAQVARLAGDGPPQPLSLEDFETAFGASSADLDSVAAFAASHRLAVVARDAGRRTMVLSGAAGDLEAAFGVELHQFDYPDGSYRGRTGLVHVPEALQDVVVAVMGLDARPVARPHFRVLRQEVAGAFRPAAATAGSFTPVQLAQLYGFPEGDGAGQCIALIELGGGYKPADLKAYFKGLGVRAPKVTAIGVDHGRNAPTGDAGGPDGEVMLDIEVAGAIAPAAHIAVYFAPNTDAGFLDAITQATHDRTNRPSIISISWGGPERSWTAQSLAAFDDAFQAAALLGVSVLAASGDNGSSDGLTDGAEHVDFPASSPHVTACGGTRVAASNGRLSAETVWNDGAQGGAGGGGVSAGFARPDWQMGLAATDANGARQDLPRRGVPDVAGDADPQTGYQVRVDGADMVYGGTSAVAPLWAGLIARINAASARPAGFLNPTLYKRPDTLNDVTAGTNGAYAATPGWDACTGLGSPNGLQLHKAFTAAK